MMLKRTLKLQHLTAHPLLCSTHLHTRVQKEAGDREGPLERLSIFVPEGQSTTEGTVETASQAQLSARLDTVYLSLLP